MDKFEKVYNSYKFGKIVLYKEIKKNYRIQEKKNTHRCGRQHYAPTIAKSASNYIHERNITFWT